ncbi:YVTN repeat-like/Quino protein amine dehydrogenase [Bimuria novae-zelandiae CBS 107.79]|uniref:YVTN repeat-like/Quino protein amine dehydrogenase n=1 Tax=Bimuria novae-zelandiae CBS 107.79 TaxID=1447943 RepID=A0A6A5V7Y4_9PLEO|nr:YVTN repeat-like/Quino protein amine dehydrogenase [Bimuria novae-zelandiae CBS 107.79]
MGLKNFAPAAGWEDNHQQSRVFLLPQRLSTELRVSIAPCTGLRSEGISASYAPNHPKEWSNEKDGFDFMKDITHRDDDDSPSDAGNRAYYSFHTAISCDSRLLAISGARFPNERVLIYDVATKKLRQVLDGCGPVSFRYRAEGGGQEVEEASATRHISGRPGYTLISSIPTGEARGMPENQLILWELDHNGRLMDEEEPIDPSAIATKAIEVIAPLLESEHEWSQGFVADSNLHTDFVQALNKASAEHRRRHNTVFQNASLPAVPFNSDGSLLLYLSKNESTQRGMREPDALPHVVMYNTDTGREVHRLRGHTDRVVWAGFSPDEQHIASVSWDGTLRMYSSQTGGLEWSTTNSGGQSYASSFSSDSKYIVWSSNLGKEVAVHTVTWMDEGRLLYLTTSEGTTVVYETLTNVKEVFKRPSGVEAAHIRPSFYELPQDEDGNETYMSIDGDGKVRYWDRSVAPLPEARTTGERPVAMSWREKRVEEEDPATNSADEKEAWAVKGAGIWTAE